MRWYEKLYVGEKAKKAQIRNDPGGPKWKTNGLLCPDSGGWGAEPFRYLSGADIKASLL